MVVSDSFTLTANHGLLRALQTDCQVSTGFDPNMVGTPPVFHAYQAIWDTGATGTVISNRIAIECGLQPIGMTVVNGVNGQHNSNKYLINIRLPNGVGVQLVEVTEGNLGGNFDVLIGMDIISLGDFSITNKNQKTIFSFRIPSLANTDFVKEHLQKVAQQNHGTSKPRPKKAKSFGKAKK